MLLRPGPALGLGIWAGTETLPHFSDAMLQQTCAVVYAIILAQRMVERYGEIQRERNPTAQVFHWHCPKAPHPPPLPLLPIPTGDAESSACSPFGLLSLSR